MKKLWKGILQWFSRMRLAAGKYGNDCGCDKGVGEMLNRIVSGDECHDESEGMYLSRIYMLLAKNPDDEFVNSKFNVKWDRDMKPCSRRLEISKFGCEISNSVIPVPDRIEFDESIEIDPTGYCFGGDVPFIPYGSDVLIRMRNVAETDIAFFYEGGKDGSGIHKVGEAMERFFGFDGSMVSASSRIDNILVRHMDRDSMVTHEFFGCIPKRFDLNEGKVELVSNYVRTQTTGNDIIL